jgi:hypothetical protein
LDGADPGDVGGGFRVEFAGLVVCGLQSEFDVGLRTTS